MNGRYAATYRFHDVARRDSGDKQTIPLVHLRDRVGELLAGVQTSLLRAARDEQERRTLREPNGYDEMVEYLRDAGGFVAASWCGRRECEVRVKDEASATIRCLPLVEHEAEGTCVCCGRRAVSAAVWAQAY